MLIIIVLGNSKTVVRNKRMDMAIAEFKKDPCNYINPDTNEVTITRYILCSGGPIIDNNLTEADLMREYAIEKGIDPKYILVEKESMNTIENLTYCRKMLLKMFPFNVCFRPDLVICTSSYHMKRSLILTKLLISDFNCRFIHTKDKISNEDYFRESYILNITIDNFYKNEWT